ncbi:exopolysaccharide biosynthesis polyprenyl glycosylphosphotransferase [Nocardioides sp. W7]|uniref:exopolysaccharide biosynthesis polyprenyl glycosylphosphotransferase n=1 Tax=Nocardioides sp. W7 TaxID=2931390 RepID=UPI001FD35319|nr:exopolysaccharide biosynthesis polyprenyl glycosylphosphotransferase [Nocardioides sp. W7]
MVTTTPEALPRSVSTAPASVTLVAAPPDDCVAPARGRSLHRHRLAVVGADALTALVGTLLVALPATTPESGLLLVVPVLWLVLLAATGAHRHGGTRPVLRAGTMLGLTCWVASAVPAGPAGPATALRLIVLTAVLVLTALAVRRLLGAPDTRVLLVGERSAVDGAVDELSRPGHRFVLAGVATGCTDGPGTLADLATRGNADAVLALPGSGLDAVHLRRLGWELERRGLDLYVGTGLLDVCATRTSPDRVGDLGLLHVRGSVRRGPQRVTKEIGERALAAVALLLLSPLLLTLAAVVRTSTRGPALFRQTRIGLEGRPFTMLKLRTMSAGSDRPDAALTSRNEGAGGVLFKLRDDPRVTRVGRVLRRYSLDELPQLVNVLRGDMSLIGPRPALPQEVERYAVDPLRRLAVRPGLTGLWQVSGRSDLSWDETVRLDLSYVDNWSLALDARIALRTVGAVVSHRGAY